MKIENINDDTLREILLQGNYITAAELKRAEKAMQAGASLTDVLLAENIVSKDLIGQAVAEALSVPYADLNSLQPTREQVLKVPEDIAKQYRVVLFSENDKEVVIATDNPQQEERDLFCTIHVHRSRSVM